jgi:hypothetical protein
LAEGLVDIGFPRDVDRAVAILRRVSAPDPSVLEGALALARRRSQVRRSMVLVVELLIQASTESPPMGPHLKEIDLRDVSVTRDDRLVAVGAD